MVKMHEMNLSGKRIFISGGSGFVGSNLVRRLLLIPSCSITVYDNLSSGHKDFLRESLKTGRVRLVVADLLDFSKLRKAFRGHEIVFHLASNPDIAKGLEDPSLDLRLGILTTFNVMEAMRLEGGTSIIYTSGSGVYGDLGTRPLAEDYGPLKPISMYGATKLGSEAIISAFCHMFHMQAWCFRPANIVGPHQTHGVGYDFIKKLSRNPRELTILGDGTQSKSYIYVDDFIDAVLLVIKKAHEPVNIFNVASPTFIDVKSIAKVVVESMNLSRVKFVFTGGKRGWQGDVPKVRMDTQKLRRLGWKPLHTSRQAIQESVRHLLSAAAHA